MSRNRRTSLVLILGLAVSALVVPALHGQDAQTWRVLVVRTELGSAPAYEAALGQLFAAAKKHGMKTPVFASSSTDEPGTYIFASPFSSMAEVDPFVTGWTEIYSNVPDVIAALGDASLENDVNFYVERPDLSYMPAEPRLTDEQAVFSRIVWLYPRADRFEAFQEAVRSFSALSMKHGADRANLVFEQTIGGGGPVFGVMISDESQAAFFANGEKMQAAWGDDWTKAVAELSPTVHKIEYSSSLARPDLSYQP